MPPVWAVLDCFGYKEVFNELNGPKIHRLENVFILEVPLHIYGDLVYCHGMYHIFLPLFAEPDKELGSRKNSTGINLKLLPRMFLLTSQNPRLSLRRIQRSFLFLNQPTCIFIQHAQRSHISPVHRNILRDLEEIPVLAEAWPSCSL